MIGLFGGWGGALAANHEFASVRIDLDGKVGLCPGEHVRLTLVAAERAHPTRLRPVASTDFRIGWDIAPVDRGGELVMPLDPKAAWGRPGALTVTWIADPTVTASAALPLRYDCIVEVGATGQPGASGPVGLYGTSASSAEAGDGRSGGDGADGGDGPDLVVRVARVEEPLHQVEVLQVRVADLRTGATWDAAVSPEGGRVSISATGGPGGRGGSGGAGGSGGCAGGDGGDGGGGGDGGKGGRVTVVADPDGRARAILSIENDGGAGGLGGTAGAGGATGPEPVGTVCVSGFRGFAGAPGAEGPAGPPTEWRAEAVDALW